MKNVYFSCGVFFIVANCEWKCQKCASSFSILCICWTAVSSVIDNFEVDKTVFGETMVLPDDNYK